MTNFWSGLGTCWNLLWFQYRKYHALEASSFLHTLGHLVMVGCGFATLLIQQLTMGQQCPLSWLATVTQMLTGAWEPVVQGTVGRVSLPGSEAWGGMEQGRDQTRTATLPLLSFALKLFSLSASAWVLPLILGCIFVQIKLLLVVKILYHFQ